MEIINDPAISAELSNMSYTNDGLNSGSAVNDFVTKDLQDKMSIYDKLYGSSAGLGTGLSARNPQNQRLTQDEILARKQDRQQAKSKELIEDDSNLMLNLKSAYNAVNNLWDGRDLQANYMGKKEVMSNKIFEDTGHSMYESELERQKLIDQYNNAKDDPNAKQKVYQLRIQDGIDENGNPIYTYKTGLAETSAADRYKNQVKAQGYEILSEKGMANAQEWENKWHGNRANLSDRTFDTGFNEKGKNIKDLSNFGEGYSEIYNTQHFNVGESQDDINANMQKSIQLKKEMDAKKAAGYGKGSASMIDAFQAGAVKLGLDTEDTVLDVLTPGNNTFLDETRKQQNIDTMVGYNRKDADKAIGEATARFNDGNYSGALWEVLKNPQIMTESLPAMAEMTLGFGKFTTAGKALTALGDAKKISNLDKRAEAVMEAQKKVDDLTNAQKTMYKVADNAGFLTQVMSETNNQIEDRVRNNAEVGVKGGDSYGEIAGVFPSEFVNLGIDRFAFNKITGIEGGKLSIEKAFDLLDTKDKADVVKNVSKVIAGLSADGALEGAQEYVQTWGEIINTQYGTAKNGTLDKIFGDKENQNETVGAMLAGAGSGIHMAAGADAISKGYDKTLEAFGKVTATQKNANDIKDMSNLDDITSGSNSSHFDGLTAEDGSILDLDKVRANAREKLKSVNRSGANYLYSKALEPEVMDEATGDSSFKSSVKNMILGTHDLLTDEKYNAAKVTVVDGKVTSMEPEYLKNVIEFETKTSQMISKLVEGLNHTDSKEKLVNRLKEEGRLPEGASLEEAAQKEINKKQLDLITAVGELRDDPRVRPEFANNILEIFKNKMLDEEFQKELEKSKQAKESKYGKKFGESNTDSVSEEDFNLATQMSKQNESKNSGSKVKDEPTTEFTISNEKKDHLLNIAQKLYSLGGKQDDDLASMIEELDNAKETSSGNTTIKSVGNITSNILNTGFNSKRGNKKSVTQHTEDINNSLDGFTANINDVNQDDIKTKQKLVDVAVKTIDKNVGAFNTFMASRIGDSFSSYTDNHSISGFSNDNLVDLVYNPNTTYEDINKFADGLIDANGGKTELVKNDKEAYNEYVANKRNAQYQKRNVILGAATQLFMSSSMQENKILVQKADQFINKLETFLVVNENNLDEESRAKIVKQLNNLRDVRTSVDVKSKLVKAMWNKLHNKSIVEDKKLLSKMMTANKQSEEEYRAYENTEKFNESSKNAENEKEGNFNKSDKPKVRDIINDKNENITAKTGIQSFSTKNSSVLKNMLQIALNKTGAKFASTGSKSKKALKLEIKKLDNVDSKEQQGNFDSSTVTITLNEDMLNDTNTAHELVHYLTYEEFSKGKINKKDLALINQFKENIKVLKDEDLKGLSDNAKRLIELANSNEPTANYEFNMELVAMLSTEPEIRRFFANNIDGVKYRSNKDEVNDITSMLKRIAQAFKFVSDFIKSLARQDEFNKMSKEDQIKYEIIYQLLGNTLSKKQKKDSSVKQEVKQEAKESNTDAEVNVETKVEPEVDTFKEELDKSKLEVNAKIDAAIKLAKQDNGSKDKLKAIKDYIGKTEYKNIEEFNIDKSAIKDIIDIMNNISKNCK